MESFHLAARRLFDIPDAAAVQVHCTAGSLWITLDHDQRDIILAPGECFSTGEHRRALLYALEPAAFALCAAPPVRNYAQRRTVTHWAARLRRRPTPQPAGAA